MNQLRITTASLRLRQFVAEDVARIRALNAEASTRRWLPSHVYETLEDARAALAYLIGCYTAPGDPRRGPYVLAVEHLHTGDLLGHVGFSPLDDEVEISYAIAESARGQGLGTEAVVCACDWLARSFAVPRIVAATAHANHISRRLLERSGFVHQRDALSKFQGRETLVSRYSRTATPTEAG